MLGMPAARPSIAAETVPEYSTSSPMFGPWFTPEITQFGPWGISAPRASSTQSVGVPSTWKPPSERRWARSGRCRVRECDVPLCSRSGATTVTCPTVAHTSASSAIPGARMPSSLETRIRRGVVMSLLHDPAGVPGECACHAPGIAPGAEMAARPVDRRNVDGNDPEPGAQGIQQEVRFVLIAIPCRLDALGDLARKGPEPRLRVPHRLPPDARRQRGREPVGEAAGDGHSLVPLHQLALGHA